MRVLGSWRQQPFSATPDACTLLKALKVSPRCKSWLTMLWPSYWLTKLSVQVDRSGRTLSYSRLRANVSQQRIVTPSFLHSYGDQGFPVSNHSVVWDIDMKGTGLCDKHSSAAPSSSRAIDHSWSPDIPAAWFGIFVPFQHRKPAPRHTSAKWPINIALQTSVHVIP